MSGFLLHQDSQRVIIATLGSKNAKTGGMVQIWILAAAQDPIQTIRISADDVVCGKCKHRGRFGRRTCYVRMDLAPLSIWRCWDRGNYPFLPQSRYADVFGGRMVRFGAYGDPFYVPTSILRWIAFFSKGWTGYTHQWQDAAASHLKPYLMASVDSEAEFLAAKAAGWRTFRVRSANSPLQHREIVCPASGEAGHRTTCASCGLCNGSQRHDKRADITILAHGIGKRNFAKTQLIQIGKVA